MKSVEREREKMPFIISVNSPFLLQVEEEEEEEEEEDEIMSHAVL